jgi:hypothetical protein
LHAKGILLKTSIVRKGSKIEGTACFNPTDQSLCDQSDFIRSIASQSITFGDQSCGFIGTIDLKN